MGFNKFDRGGRNGGGFGGNGNFSARGGSAFGRGGRSEGPREMHPATCSQCGQSCEIPFRPSGDRPVFCNSCFKSQGAPSQRFTPKSFGGGNRGGSFGGNANAGAVGGVTKTQIDALNVKLDKIISMLTTNKIAESPKTALIEIKDKKEDTKKEKAPAKKAKGKKK